MFPVFDTCIVAAILGFFVFLGYRYRVRKDDSTSATYFLAQRTMFAIPAALSITVSLMSSSALTIFLGEMFVYGCPHVISFLPIFIGGIFVIVFVVPRFYDSPYISAYQFLEHRFSRSVRMTNSAIFIISGIINSSAVGYTAAISLETLVGVPFWISAVLSGLLSTAYSTLGGIRVVIWTDACQGMLMFLYLIIIIVKGSLSFNNFEEFWEIVSAGNRIKIRFEDGPRERCSIPAFYTFSFIVTLHMLSVSQYGVQRWKSVKNVTEARKAVFFTALFMSLLFAMMNICGLVLYAFYIQCSEREGPLPTADKVSLYFVLKELAAWPGVLGLCMAGILSGALSTMSSFVNSMAAVTLEDFVKIRFTPMNEKQELRLSIILSLCYGLITTSLIFITALSKAVFVVQVMVASIAMGPPLGSFFLAVWTKRTNTFGVNLGLVIAVVIVSWLSIGSFLAGNVNEPQQSGNTTCFGNTTSIMRSIEDSVWTRIGNQEEYITNSFLLRLYRISFYWYSLIGCGTSAVLGYVFSICYLKITNRNMVRGHTNEEEVNGFEAREISKALLTRKFDSKTVRAEDRL